MQLKLKNDKKQYHNIKAYNLKNKNKNKKNNDFITNRNKLSLIEEQNLFLFNRIKSCSPCYNVDKWEKDFKKSRYYKMNYCHFPKINFRKYKKINNIQNKSNNTSKINYENYNSDSILLSEQNKLLPNFISLDNINNANNNSDLISLHFFLINKYLSEKSYIITTTLDEIFSNVIEKLFKIDPLIDKEKIGGYLSSEKKHLLLKLDKTVKDNELKDGSQIIILYK